MSAPGKSSFFASPVRLGWTVSVVLHGAAFWLLSTGPGFWAVHFPAETIEVDLSRPFRITSDPSKVHRTQNPGAGAPKVSSPTPIAGSAPAVKPPEWVLPTPTTTKFVEPSTAPATEGGVPGGKGEGPGLGGLGGEGDGEVDWVLLTDVPRLLNRDELFRDIRRFYPEGERRAGREGRVDLMVHIDASGRVGRLEVAESAGAAFDAAARRVMTAARFSPARIGARRVAVKIRQSVAFRLED
jgi:TonB family protein